MNTAKTPILFDDVDVIDNAREEVHALIVHARGLALLMSLAADNGQLSADEAYQLLTGLVHRASRVRFAIAREQAMALAAAKAA